jgi:hypothetical protein
MIGGIGMREILFKAKEIGSGEWVYGYYAVLSSPKGSSHAIIPKHPEIVDIVTGGNMAHEIDPGTLCQYTGMKDSKGSRIFENDILGVYFPETAGPTWLRVVWKDSRFRTWEFNDKELDDDLDKHLCTKATVVGNSFDGRVKRWQTMVL